ncbi:MAG TPA: preprotein translocase subunit SecG, partial [Microscillaceae bacterium]|nr:preprotein translocase subunit SecG [Microscillaceae bacterium]
VLLVLVVLAQNSKGGGLNSTFGGGGSNQMIGVKKTTDLLERITWGLAIALFVLTLATKVPAITGIGASSSDSNPEGIEANPTPKINGNPNAVPQGKTLTPNGNKKPAAGDNKKPANTDSDKK